MKTLTYSNNSKNVCICTSISIALILIFIISPLSKYFLASFLGKSAAILILVYVLFQNHINTNNLSKSSNVHLFKGSWSDIKSNILCGYIFSFFILLLLFSTMKHVFM